MALTLARTLVQPVASQGINNGSSYTSAEQDGGDNALYQQIWLTLDIATSWAGTPSGLMTVQILPVHTTGGTAYGDQNPLTFSFSCTANQAYAFPVPVAQLPRYYKIKVTNSTGQNTAASAVNVRIEYVKVTA